MDKINSSYTQKVFPSTSLDESSIEFEFDKDRILYLDMRDTHLSLKLQLLKGRLFDAFKKERAEHEGKLEEDSDEEPQTYSTYVNVSLKIVDCSLFTRRILVAEPNNHYLQ